MLIFTGTSTERKMQTMNIESMKLAASANAQNCCYISGDIEKCKLLMIDVFNTVQKKGNRLLLEMETGDSIMTGIAFASIAMCLETNDGDINQIASEYALYCCAKPFFEANVTIAIPALFFLAANRPELLRVLMYTAGHDEEETVKLAYFLMTLIYDSRDRRLRFRTGMAGIPDFIRSADEITAFHYNIMQSDPDFSHEKYASDGLEILNALYSVQKVMMEKES